MPKLFSAVRWSGPHALADTLANAAGRTVALVDRLADVDTDADYFRWRKRERPAHPATRRPSVS
ncbi:MAG: hypothetical protein R3D02_12480 [Hyphomicrobiales bacterium]